MFKLLYGNMLPFGLDKCHRVEFLDQMVTLCLTFFERERERKRQSASWGRAERETESEAGSSELLAQSPTQGSNS